MGSLVLAFKPGEFVQLIIPASDKSQVVNVAVQATTAMRSTLRFVAEPAVKISSSRHLNGDR